MTRWQQNCFRLSLLGLIAVRTVSRALGCVCMVSELWGRG